MKVLRMMIIAMFFSLASSYSTITIIALFNKSITFSGSDLLEEFVIALVLGWVIGLISSIFLLERIPIYIKLFIHFLLVTVCVMIAGKIGSWYKGFDSTLWILFLSEIVIYIIIWIILYIMIQRDVDEINKKINKMRGA